MIYFCHIFNLIECSDLLHLYYFYKLIHLEIIYFLCHFLPFITLKPQTAVCAWCFLFIRHSIAGRDWPLRPKTSTRDAANDGDDDAHAYTDRNTYRFLIFLRLPLFLDADEEEMSKSGLKLRTDRLNVLERSWQQKQNLRFYSEVNCYTRCCGFISQHEEKPFSSLIFTQQDAHCIYEQTGFLKIYIFIFYYFSLASLLK